MQRIIIGDEAFIEFIFAADASCALRQGENSVVGASGTERWALVACAIGLRIVTGLAR